uniref:Macro domain-containing protein n=1 Tax=Mola mola TaxID=94237 RepID=A0A3Q3VS38_MOLML
IFTSNKRKARCRATKIIWERRHSLTRFRPMNIIFSSFLTLFLRVLSLLSPSDGPLRSLCVSVCVSVDGCIHKAAGSCLYDECHSLNGCDTGKAKITCGYDLPARYVIHTVGPVARSHVGPTETNDLTSCYQNSLRLMKEHGLSTVVSTVHCFPNEPAAEIALNTVKSWIEDNPDKVGHITRVIFCVFLETDFVIYKKKMSVIFPGMCIHFQFTGLHNINSIMIDHMLVLARVICEHGSSQAAVVVESKSMLKLILGTLHH